MKYSGHGELLCELSKLSKFNAVASILVYKFRPERTGFNMYVEYITQNCNKLSLHYNLVYGDEYDDHKHAHEYVLC